MECPKCHKPMKKLQWNLLRNGKTEDLSNENQAVKIEKEVPHKEYQRTLYVCDDDDIWITIEEPADS